MADLIPVKRALISVSDKTDLVPFARRLVARGVAIISTGGTARALTEAGIAVTAIDEVTGFPEMMDGRLKTLHPRVHGGLLALRDNEGHVAAMKEHGIEPIDLVCVNLYPFEKTIAKPDVKDEQAIEQIDIGGPSMVRSASKNHRFVAVVTDPAQYDMVGAELDSNDGSTTLRLRKRLAAAAFARTAAYDTAIAQWMAKRDPSTPGPELFPEVMVLRLNRAQVLRYGENPHQAGVLYHDPRIGEASVATARQLHGKELSFNNLYDANGALELVKEINPADACAAAVIKHANPCGFAAVPVANGAAEAFDKAYAGDPLAAFGGIIAFNCKVDLAAAQRIVEGQKFLEVIVAPDYDPEALALICDRWKMVRVLQTDPLSKPAQREAAELDFKKITAGLLVQQRDLATIDLDRWQHTAGPAPGDDTLNQLFLATLAVKHLKSNAVCIVKDGALVGAGAGQMDRVASCRLAIDKAGERARGGAVGSDAFFPFRDGPDLLIKAGVTAIAHPGGSKRDDETIAACNEANVTLMFTGMRHFRH
ncbi:MAG: bifunctional phosphoribosylaminoimidazolecarboxamide formyltransferase/IMP cyclohydrolase [Phycisphaeraceae bacterium]